MRGFLNIPIPEPGEHEVVILAVQKTDNGVCFARTAASKELFGHVNIQAAGGIILADLQRAFQELEKEPKP